ncbi:YibE/F family protein [Nocardioides sp. URHA0020]|uniref:YibE/F family protein n=1 Tax=Nocardioides sp. URHA0020 TaxID=1380392 RepID=UPI0006840A41|nr:YibE/F family protein [Nocardioides sp. URHA0020]
MGAGHSHGSHRAGGDADLVVARAPRLVLLATLAIAGIAALAGILLLWPSSAEVDRVTQDVTFAAPGVTFPNATVESINAPCTAAETGSDSDCGRMEVTVADGAGKGDRATVQISPQVQDSGLSVGDRVKLQRTPGADDADAAYSYFGTVRTGPVVVLLLVFVGLVLAVARWRGLFALVGLAFSGLVIWRFVLPALLVGESGVAVALTSAALIMFVVLYTTHGFSLRTSTALAGTLAGVLVTAGIGVVATAATRLTGIADEQAGILSALVGDLGFQDLFACAVIIAGLGVLNDVTITQSSAVWEIRAASPAMGRAQLFASGMRIGRDHIASTIYTIVFAYAGTALAVLLVLRLYGLPWDVLLATEDITEEIVRTLASSIGLVLAVPLTTAIAALVVPGARSLSE